MGNKIVFSNSWQSFLYPVDFSIQHGTTAGHLLYVPENKSTGSLIMRWMEKISCNTAKKLVAVGKNAADELETFYHINKEKIDILINFVDEKLFYPENRSADKTIRILFSGRLEKRKGLHILKNLSDYIETIEGYTLAIACNTNDNRALFSCNAQTAIYSGLNLTQMRSFYNSGDILFFPSIYEGFSMATLEALSCGLPVIGTKFAIPEELRQYEFTRIYDMQQIPVLLEQITDMVDMYRNKKAKIHETIKKDFGYQQYEMKLTQLINVYLKKKNAKK
jgi:glycosyltransferase involved in cell wall biosynthesis